MKLDLSVVGPPAEPKLAATIVLLRDSDAGPEVFCVVRSGKSQFLAGALVFPGGKLDAEDRAWADELEASPTEQNTSWRDPRPLPHASALAVAAIRETLEEADIALCEPDAPADQLRESLRAQLLTHTSLRAALTPHGLRPALAALVPMARWITPTREPRRFDTAFFVARAPAAQHGRHDDHETVGSTWATPRALLERWEQDEIAMVPPTHATLAWLAAQPDVAAALAHARTLSLAPLCPELVPGPPPSLVLPGDPAHSIARAEHPYARRYTLHSTRFVPA